MNPKIVGISTSKGRLEHVKISSKSFIDNSFGKNIDYLLVDYNCPQDTGKWLKDNYKNNSNVHSLNIRNGSDIFHKTVALNNGGKYAIHNLNADYLLFFDADTIIEKGFIEKITPLLKQDRFIIVDPTFITKDLTGLIILHKNLFNKSKGFEESFRDWGSEDVEFRLRLFLKHKIEFDIVDGCCLSSIPHEDNLRTEFYLEKNTDISNTRNCKRMMKMLSEFKINTDDESIKQLLCFLKV